MAAMRTTVPAKPRPDVYTGLLIVALLAQIAGAAFLYLDWQEYPAGKPSITEPPKSAQPPAVVPPRGTPPVPPGGGAPKPPAAMGGGLGIEGKPPGGP